MTTTPELAFEGFLVHCWNYQGQLRACGRLSDGRSFALLATDTKADWVVEPAQGDAAAALLRNAGIAFSVRPLLSFEGQPRVAFSIPSLSWSRVEGLLGRAGMPHRGPAPRATDDWLLAHRLTGAVRVRGAFQAGRQVDVVFRSPTVEPSEASCALVWASIDIETARDGTVRSLAVAQGDRSKVLFLPDYEDEGALLAASNHVMRELDPDVLTGWNVLDFDLAHLARRFARWGVAFLWGRTDEAVRIRRKPGARTRAFVAGRQVVDAMRIARGSGTRFEDQSLNTVATHVLGRAKTVEKTGEAKLAELDRLYAEQPKEFCDYCLQDARLVLDILDKSGLAELTIRRASLTGVSLDLAWTSIPVFERIYALELSTRGVLPPDRSGREVSGAAGGMVLEPRAGLFDDVVVFDFRSLYPSIIRTFGIDPLGHERPGPDPLVAPNGARFSREPGILPALITRYFESRQAAQARGDETASYVYKILMNSFYGVLGSSGCVYGRTELAGAITAFGRRCLEFTRDWFEAGEMPVLYGDTDSVFVQTRGDADALARELNRDLGAYVERTWKVRSFLTLRCEKHYRRFLIPPMRHQPGDEAPSGDMARGRAKGYAGWVLQPDGSMAVEVKGMEAVRSDWTPLARRFQTELLEQLFRSTPREGLIAWKDELLGRLRRGELDAELVYRKILRRPARDYEGHGPPQVRAARQLGWTDRKGTIEYWMTARGPRPVGMPGEPPDYQHYRRHQLRPLWDSLLEAAGIDPGPEWGNQLELEWP